MDLDGRRRPVEVEDDVLAGLVIAKPTLDDLDDAVHPFLHVLAGNCVEKRGQLVQKISVLKSRVGN